MCSKGGQGGRFKCTKVEQHWDLTINWVGQQSGYLRDRGASTAFCGLSNYVQSPEKQLERNTNEEIREKPLAKALAT